MNTTEDVKVDAEVINAEMIGVGAGVSTRTDPTERVSPHLDAIRELIGTDCFVHVL